MALYKHITTLVAIGAIILVYCMALIDYVAPATFGSYYDESFKLLVFANRVALMTLLINGRLIDSPHFKFIKLAFGLLLIGAIMKIIHVPAADHIRFLGIAGIAITYTLHFYSKGERSTLDILKLLVVILTAIPFKSLLPYIIAEYINLATELLCAITFLYFLYAERNSYMRNPNT